jgi:hypothetical protein
MFRTALVLFVAALAGCSKVPSNENAGSGKETAIVEVAGLLRTASGEGGQAPKKPADLAKYEAGYPFGYAAVKSGDVVVVWGAKMAGEGEVDSAPANVIAYEKQAPSEGGLVLLQNGKVSQMSAAEFASAPKAK